MHLTRGPLPVLALSLLALQSALAQGEAPLAGPRVKAREVPGVLEQYAPGDLGRFAGANRSAPLPVFFEGVRSLDEQGLALSREQREQVRRELAQFHDELRAFMDAHGGEVRALVARLPKSEQGRAAGEIRSLQRLGLMLERLEDDGFPAASERGARRQRADGARAADRAGGHGEDPLGERFRLEFRPRPGASAETDAPGMEEMAEAGEDSGARERLLELRELAPSPGALQTRLWSLLTEAQRGVVGEAVEAFLAEQRAEAEAQRLERDIERRRAEAAQRQAEGRTETRRPALDARARERLLAQLDGGVVPDELWDALPERVRERVSALPEDRRAGALARLLRSRTDARRDP